MTNQLTYHKYYETAEALFAKVKHGGVIKLISHDSLLQVDVKIEHFAGVYGLAVKLPADKRFQKSYVRDIDYIINYFAQFVER